MRIIFYTGLLLLLLSSWQCKKPGCIGKAGPQSSQQRDLSSFSSIILQDNVSLELIQDNAERIELEGAQNILPNVTCTIADGVLTIANESTCEWLRDPNEKIRARLHFKDLKKIDYRGSGNITNRDTLRLDYLQIESEIGAGDIILTLNNRYTGAYIFKENAGIYLHGKSESCFTYTNARARAEMGDFEVKKMVIEYGGVADTHINVTEELDAIVFWTGNILYKGNPVIKRALYYSSGRLIKF